MSRKKNTIYKTAIKQDNFVKTLKKRILPCREQSWRRCYFYRDINQFYQLSGLRITQAPDQYLKSRGSGEDLNGKHVGQGRKNI
jgi:hypothetical protein